MKYYLGTDGYMRVQAESLEDTEKLFAFREGGNKQQATDKKRAKRSVPCPQCGELYRNVKQYQSKAHKAPVVAPTF